MKQKSKRLIAFALTLMIALSALATSPVLGAEDLRIVVSASHYGPAAVGDIVDIVISLDVNTRGITTLQLDVEYDPAVLRREDVVLAPGAGLRLPMDPPDGDNPFTIGFDYRVAIQSTTYTGPLAIVSFEVLADTPTDILLSIYAAGVVTNLLPGYIYPPYRSASNGSVNREGGGEGHAITFTDAHGSTASPNPAEPGETVTLTPGTRPGFTHTGWTAVGVTITGNTFVMPDGPVAITATWAPSTPGEAPLLGDANEDGVRTSADATFIARSVILGPALEPGSDAFLNADINGDGTVDLADVTLLARRLVGHDIPGNWER